MSEYSSDVPGTHTVWECAYRIGRAEHCDISCICMCHGINKYPLMIRARGIHIHEWRARLYHLEGRADNMAIWCSECKMDVPRGSKPDIVTT